MYVCIYKCITIILINFVVAPPQPCTIKNKRDSNNIEPNNNNNNNKNNKK